MTAALHPSVAGYIEIHEGVNREAMPLSLPRAILFCAQQKSAACNAAVIAAVMTAAMTAGKK